MFVSRKQSFGQQKFSVRGQNRPFLGIKISNYRWLLVSETQPKIAEITQNVSHVKWVKLAEITQNTCDVKWVGVKGDGQGKLISIFKGNNLH